VCGKSQQNCPRLPSRPRTVLAGLPYLLLVLASGCFIEPNPSPTNDPYFPGAASDTATASDAFAADVNSPPPPEDTSTGADATAGDTGGAEDAGDAEDAEDAGDAGILDVTEVMDASDGELSGVSDCGGWPTEGVDI
jgi:hypothetical protein